MNAYRLTTSHPLEGCGVCRTLMPVLNNDVFANPTDSSHWAMTTDHYDDPEERVEHFLRVVREEA